MLSGAIPAVEAGASLAPKRPVGSDTPGVNGSGLFDSPFSSPMWLTAEAASDPTLEPLPVATDAGSCGSLAAYRLSSPPRADLDPVTYLQASCCSDGAECGPEGDTRAVDEQLPVLVLGSPAALVSEASGRPSRPAADALVDAAVDQAQATGCRALLAPWCVDRGSGALLKAALEARGAVVQRRSYAHSIDLRGRTYASFAAGLPRPVRSRRERESAAARDAGYRLVRLTPDDWARQRPAAARLAAELDAGEELAPDQAGPWALLDFLEQYGPDVHAWAAYRDDELRGCVAFLAHDDALWLTLRALAREPRGFPSGLYFLLLLQEVVASAYQMGFSRVEYGVSSSGAWVLRGCDATPAYSCLLPIAARA